MLRPVSFKNAMQNYEHEYLLLQSKQTSRNVDFSVEAQEIFQNLVNPYKFCLACLTHNENVDLYSCKDNYLGFRILKEFCTFLSSNDDSHRYFYLLTRGLQLEAFEILKKIRIIAVQRNLIKCFCLGDNPDFLIPLLRKDLESTYSQNIIFIIGNLNFGKYFSFDQLLIPTLLRNNIQFIEKFLDDNSSYRLPFIQFLDRIVGNEIQIPDLVCIYLLKEFDYKNIPKEKSIYQLCIRLMKNYEVSPKDCPNVIFKHNMSSLRFLFHRCYNESGFTVESLVEFVKDLSKDSDILKREALDLFVEYYDYEAALQYIAVVQVCEKDIPHQIKDYRKDISSGICSGIKSLSNHDSNIQYFQLKLPLDSVIWVGSLKMFLRAVSYLSSCTVLGVDCEWTPSFQFYTNEHLSLLQIASRNNVFIFDMFLLPDVIFGDHWEKLGKIFSDKTIMKVSYSFSGDRKNLKSFNDTMKTHIEKMSNVIDLYEIQSVLLKGYPYIFPYPAVEQKGLSELVCLCFGKPLDKIEQCSCWNKRPLSSGQLKYAALDAYCLIQIFDFINERGKVFNIPEWKSVKPSKSTADAKITLENDAGAKSKQYSEEVKTRKITNAVDFHVVCDTMLQGLGKLLRFCNIDAAILNNEDPHDKCVDIFEKEKRIVLTKGTVYQYLRKYIPSSHVYCVQGSVPKEQLEELTREFNIKIEISDIFARCAACNNNMYLHVQPEIILKMKNFRYGKQRWVEVEGGSVCIGKGTTDKNVKIKLNKVPYAVLKKVSVIDVCVQCGKCYWDGSHLSRFRKDVENVIQGSETGNPVQI